jgi:hypothetical protein
MRPVGLSVSIVLLIVAGGCASAIESGEAPGGKSGFSGSWSVDWCNPDRPDLECGGFSVTLRQSGSRVCGEYGGALVNLRQIDEGVVDGIEESDGTARAYHKGHRWSCLESAGNAERGRYRHIHHRDG